MENVFDTKRKIDNIHKTPLRVVAYLRLSREDGDGESSSIANQRKITTKFAQDRGMVIDEFYIDDGYSGFTMDRPEFNRLKRDLNNNMVDVIIFKDLSRLSRNNAKGQLFLENVLEDGKRVLTVYEGYDTFDPKTHKMVGIYGWMNEDYIRDASMKTKDAINTLQKEGAFINTVPYGYVKDSINKKLYYIDTTTAPYVMQIFELYISGMGVRAIADKLNKENVPTASMVKKRQIESTGRSSRLKTTMWTGDAIQRILNNKFYIGTLTLNKTIARTINGKRTQNPPEKYYIFEDAHDAIIDKATFQLAQEIRLQRKKKPYRGYKIRKNNIFGGILYCADCGRTLTSASSGTNIRYICTSYNQFGTNVCTSHAIMDYQIKECLITFLGDCRTELLKILSDFDNIFQREFGKQGDAENLQKDLLRIKQEVKMLMEQKLREIIKNPSMSDIIDDMYSEAMNDKYRMIESLEKQINDVINISTKENDIRKNFKSTINVLDEIINSGELTKKQVLLLVDKIIVYEDGSLDIYLKGDLHELCNNKINIRESTKDNLNRMITEYILSHKHCIYPSNCWKHVHDSGVLIGYVKFTKYFNKFEEDGIISKRGADKLGYKLTTNEETLKIYTNYNNIVDTIGGLPDNNDTTHANNVVDTIGGLSNDNVTLKLLVNISKLGMSLRQRYQKRLF